MREAQDNAHILIEGKEEILTQKYVAKEPLGTGEPIIGEPGKYKINWAPGPDKDSEQSRLAAMEAFMAGGGQPRQNNKLTRKYFDSFLHLLLNKSAIEEIGDTLDIALGSGGWSEDVEPLLKTYHNSKPAIKRIDPALMDLKNFDSFTHLKEFLGDLQRQEIEALGQSQVQRIKGAGIIRVGTVENFEIFRIPQGLQESEEAWQVYRQILCGGSTSFCTAASFEKWQEYLSDGDLFLLWNPEDGDAPYQVMSNLDQIMNKINQRVRPLPPVFFKIFKLLYNKKLLEPEIGPSVKVEYTYPKFDASELTHTQLSKISTGSPQCCLGSTPGAMAHIRIYQPGRGESEWRPAKYLKMDMRGTKGDNEKERLINYFLKNNIYYIHDYSAGASHNINRKKPGWSGPIWDWAALKTPELVDKEAAQDAWDWWTNGQKAGRDFGAEHSAGEQARAERIAKSKEEERLKWERYREEVRQRRQRELAGN